jgi:hypothetical protein
MGASCPSLAKHQHNSRPHFKPTPPKLLVLFQHSPYLPNSTKHVFVRVSYKTEMDFESSNQYLCLV